MKERPPRSRPRAARIFLDEIGDWLPLLQVKLLRALQERELERVGGHVHFQAGRARRSPLPTRTWKKRSRTGDFRQDLYYRLNVVSVGCRRLRERPDDIPLLAMYFSPKYAEKCKRPTER